MRHALADYLAEFEGALAAPRRAGFGLEPALPRDALLPTTPTLEPTPALVAALPPVYRASAESLASELVAGGLLPRTLPSGTTPLVMPVPAPPPAPVTPEAWTAAMAAETRRIDSVVLDATLERNRGRLRNIRATHPDAHIMNNYYWRQYPIPSDGSCDPSKLVWLDVWMRAKEILARMTARPPRGVSWAAVRTWAVNIGRLVSVMTDSTNLRFFHPPSDIRDAVETSTASMRLSSSSGPVTGLASVAQGRGAYTYNTRADAAASWEAMQFAPVPAGGYEELVPDLRTKLRPTRIVWTCLQPPHCGYVTDLLTVRSTWSRNLDAAFASWGATGATTFNVGLPHRLGGGRVAQGRLDIAALVDNVRDLAIVMADPRISYAAVLMRTMNFYANAYLDFAARKGVLPTDVVNNARAAWAGVQGSANAALTTATSTTFGAITAVVSAINAAAGAIVGLVLGLLSALISAEGAAVGTGPSVPWPLYLRIYEGSCEIRGWEPPPARPPGTSPSPATEAPVYSTDTEDGGGEPQKTGGIVVGATALAFGLWLLSSKK